LKNIVIAGGAGFIGSHLVDLFLNDKNNNIIVVDNLITGNKNNIKHHLDNPHFTFVEQDITETIGRFDFGTPEIHAIFHLASPASPKDYIKYPIETLEVNSYGTQNLLELARSTNAIFLFTSTSEIYGNPLVHPQHEEYWGNVNSIGPRSVYDEGKRYAESLIMAYHRKYGLDTRIVRLFNTFGPRMKIDDGRIVPNLIKQALNNDPLTIYGDGTQTRCFCYVDDTVDGIFRLYNRKYNFPINIVSTKEITILEIAQIIKQITNSNSDIIFEPLPEDDPVKRKPNITKAMDVLGWESHCSLEDGLLDTIKYFMPCFTPKP
jgi:dTDP-glucose 4,6-dehydratase